MKNLNENNGKIVPLSDEELKNATGGSSLNPADFCPQLTKQRCQSLGNVRVCHWDETQQKCVP